MIESPSVSVTCTASLAVSIQIDDEILDMIIADFKSLHFPVPELLDKERTARASRTWEGNFPWLIGLSDAYVLVTALSVLRHHLGVDRPYMSLFDPVYQAGYALVDLEDISERLKRGSTRKDGVWIDPVAK